MTANLQKLTLFYDGLCPLCQAEILFLSRRNEAGLLEFVDIHSANFDVEHVGITCEKALVSMSGQYSDGTLINGVPVFSAAYKRANLPFLAWFFSRKVLKPYLHVGYLFFAKHRHAISKVLGPGALWLVKSFTSSKGAS